MKNEKILPFIKLKYHLTPDEESAPDSDKFTCYQCGKRRVRHGGMLDTHTKKPKIICEDCAIDIYMESEGFSSREAATSRRRRIFDVGYLFNEIVTDAHMRGNGIDDFESLSEEASEGLRNLSITLFNELPKERKIALEETDNQDEIEEKLIEYLEARHKTAWEELENNR